MAGRVVTGLKSPGFDLRVPVRNPKGLFFISSFLFLREN
jgi:hypothetical protein